jgi:hypothetical protein
MNVSNSLSLCSSFADFDNYKLITSIQLSKTKSEEMEAFVSRLKAFLPKTSEEYKFSIMLMEEIAWNLDKSF